MRVALDEQIFAVQSFGGISRLFFELARSYSGEVPLELLSIDAPIVNDYLLSDAALARQLGVRRASGPYAALASYLTRRTRRTTADVIHHTFYLPRGLRDEQQAQRIVTVYDMIPELLPRTRRRLDFLTEKHRYVTRADHVVCISESTRRDLLKVHPDVHVPITIAYPGVDSRFRPDAPRIPSLPEPYVLHVGNRSSYKDAGTLLRAFTAIAGDHADLSLVLVGGGPLTRDERALLGGFLPRVTQRTLSDQDMPAAYAQATLTVFPSRYEGFGLPAVEAMASGSPLILADTSSLPEVGGQAAAYFPPGDEHALATLMVALLADGARRDAMRAQGLERARQFTWARFAAANISAYEAALAR